MISKVIIPIAGLGTRMLPASKAIPKEMLPISKKPIIQLVVEEALRAGLKEIILITHSSKSSVENHFDKNYELETTLENKVKRSLLKEIKNISKLKPLIYSMRQGEPKGLGHAIYSARYIVGKEDFAVMLPDMLFEETSNESNLIQMKKKFDKDGISSLLISRAEKKDLNKFGIVKLKNKNLKQGFNELDSIVEKPSINSAPSNLFASGRYIFKNSFFQFLRHIRSDKSGEIQLTPAIQEFIKKGNIVNTLKSKGKVYDCGNMLGYLKAVVDYSEKDPIFGKEFKSFLKKRSI